MRVAELLFSALLIIGFFAYAIDRGVRYSRLKRLVAGLKEPELWLPRKERRAHARKLLKREDDEYHENMIKKVMKELQEGNTTP